MAWKTWKFLRHSDNPFNDPIVSPEKRKHIFWIWFILKRLPLKKTDMIFRKLMDNITSIKMTGYMTGLWSTNPSKDPYRNKKCIVIIVCYIVHYIWGYLLLDYGYIGSHSTVLYRKQIKCRFYDSMLSCNIFSSLFFGWMNLWGPLPHLKSQNWA